MARAYSLNALSALGEMIAQRFETEARSTVRSASRTEYGE